MKSGKGLSKGYSGLSGASALFSGGAAAEEAVKGLPLRDIEPSPHQPRQEFDPVALEELAESIRQNGVITPITVRRSGERYLIIAGERRWRAARSAGLATIPAYVLEADDEEAYRLALVENLQRQDLNPIEEAMGFKRLIQELGVSQEEAAEKVGRSRPYITNSMRLLNLPEGVRDMVASGALTAGHGRALVTLSPKQAEEAAKRIIELELSVRETENLVKRMSGEGAKKPQKKLSDTAIYVQDLERRLGSATGHRITIRHGRKKGKLTIEYYGNEDLEHICAALERIENKK